GVVSATTRAVRLGPGGRLRGGAGDLRRRSVPAALFRPGLSRWFGCGWALSPFAAPVDEFQKLFLADLSLPDEGLNAALKALAVSGRDGLGGVDQDRDLGRRYILTKSRYHFEAVDPGQHQVENDQVRLTSDAQLD